MLLEALHIKHHINNARRISDLFKWTYFCYHSNKVKISLSQRTVAHSPRHFCRIFKLLFNISLSTSFAMFYYSPGRILTRIASVYKSLPFITFWGILPLFGICRGHGRTFVCLYKCHKGRTEPFCFNKR